MTVENGLLRRNQNSGRNLEKIDCDGFVLNIAERAIEKDNKKIELTKNEYNILYYLTTHKGKVVSSTEGLVTTALANDTLEVGQSKEINLVLTKKVTSSNVGLVTNNAKIAMSSNEKGQSDINSANHTSKAEVLIGISTNQIGIFNVTFEPGCRNNWHIHHAKSGGGQILVCVAGRGYYQERGKEAVEMKPGDCINIPAEVKHWHGAAPNEWFSHLAIEVPGEDGSNEWCEAVSEETYAKLK